MPFRLPAKDPKLEEDVKDDLDAQENIANSTRSIVSSSYRRGATPRDVHVKHHAVLAARFEVAALADPRYAKGVFAQGDKFKALVRLSNSSGSRVSDRVGDGRGFAIKLLDVKGERLLPEPGVQRSTQDFILVNSTAFFARNAADMQEAAALIAEERFPAYFFVKKWGRRLGGGLALVRIVSDKSASPFTPVYHSHTPYRLGPPRAAPLAVKYRLSLEDGHAQLAPCTAEEDGNHLYHALFAQLTEAKRPVRMAFELQLQGDGDPIDDATKPWKGGYVRVATLVIEPQRVDNHERMQFAEDMAFNPWNGIVDHQPLGSINRARLNAYHASSKLRHELNKRAEPAYSLAEWSALQNAASTPGFTSPPAPYPGRLANLRLALHSLIKRPERLLELIASWGYRIPAALFLILCGFFFWNPEFLTRPIVPRLIDMPSERAIPEARRVGSPDCTEVERVFRYEPSGSDAHGGVPYWIFRVLPKMYPEAFPGGYAGAIGLIDRDDQDCYTSYHDLPRGAILSEPQGYFLGLELGVPLHVVSFNCASCHRGEIELEPGKSIFIDGMPNTTLDGALYKVTVARLLSSDSFDPERLLSFIDAELAEQQKKVPKLKNGERAPSKLTWMERILYGFMIERARSESRTKRVEWILARTPNGSGRLDAFGAFRFEVFKADPGKDFHVATVDLPSIWGQSVAKRPWHHWDGNTSDERARNFGAVIGVGGEQFSIRQKYLKHIGAWIDRDLKPRTFPFQRASIDEIEAGRKLYEEKCQSCHGKYDDDGSFKVTDCMRGPVANVGTDPARARAVDPELVAKLNDYGKRTGTWLDAFRSTGGYLCPPLDGIWARAPYLHNGSVPTLDHLLQKADKRPASFFRGNPAYDVQRGGFVFDKERDSHQRKLFEQKVQTAATDEKYPNGDSAMGHDSDGMVVADPLERQNLIRYLLTL